jgi:hypothetical protein
MSLERTPQLGRKPVVITVKMPVPKPLDRAYLADGLRELYLLGELTDIALVCSGQTFLAHGIVLAARSEVFHQGLLATQACANTSGKKDVRVADVSNPEAVKFMLDYLYNVDAAVWAEYNPRTQEINKDIIRLSQSFKLPGLTERATVWLAKDINTVLTTLGMNDSAPGGTKFLVALANEIGPEYPISGEKMALFLALYRAKDFAEAKTKARAIHAYQGRGHSLGLHSQNDKRAHELAMDMNACRIILNQAHCFATGGSFDNGLPFSLSMGCGSWGGNSIDDNLNWTHFVNRVRIARQINPVEPAVDDIFSDYFAEVGK